jgi:hypothetical protein
MEMSRCRSTSASSSKENMTAEQLVEERLFADR